MKHELPPHPDHMVRWSPREERVLVGYFEPLLARIAELEAQLVAWNQKAATWIASPEAAKRLEGYRELTARIAELEAQLASGQEPADERAAFQAWCTSYFGPLHTTAERYVMWAAWQARATHQHRSR